MYKVLLEKQIVVQLVNKFPSFNNRVGFQILTEVSMKILGDTASCSRVEFDWRFSGAYSSGRSLMMEAASATKTLVKFYLATRLYISEHSHLVLKILVVEAPRSVEVRRFYLLD